MLVYAAIVLLATAAPLRAEMLEMDILTSWDGGPVDHVPVAVTLDSYSDDVIEVVVEAPFFNDPPPPAEDNSSYIGLWDHEVVEVFFLNDNDQYLQVEVAPRGQYFALLFDGRRNYKRFSLPLPVSSHLDYERRAWTAKVQLPTEYLPVAVTKFNAYATHGVQPDRHYEAYNPATVPSRGLDYPDAPSPTPGPDYHDLASFATIALDRVVPGLSSRPMSQLWEDALRGRIRYSMNTFWNGTTTAHRPTTFLMEGSGEELTLTIEAPFFNDPAPPGGKPGQAYSKLYRYEIVEVMFLNNEKQYLQVEVSPHGEHWVLFLWSVNDEYNHLRHSLPLEVTTNIRRNIWTAVAKIPWELLPPKVSLFNAHAQHTTGPDRHLESLYPQDSSDGAPNFHDLKYFQPIDLNSVMPGQSERPMSELWHDSIQGIFKYSIETEWNSLPISHEPAVFSLEGFEAGVEMNITAAFFNDPAPNGVSGEPFFKLWDYEVVDMFFLNDNNEYLEVELGPWGQHLLLMLKGERNTIKHSLPLDYVVTTRQEGTNGSPGMWQGSALIPPGYFPPNVTRMNAYAIHGTGNDRVYESLYPAPNNDPSYPAPDFQRLSLFQEIDFKFLVLDNSQYSVLWLDAIANSTTETKNDYEDEKVILRNEPVAAIEQTTKLEQTKTPSDTSGHANDVTAVTPVDKSDITIQTIDSVQTTTQSHDQGEITTLADSYETTTEVIYYDTTSVADTTRFDTSEQVLSNDNIKNDIDHVKQTTVSYPHLEEDITTAEPEVTTQIKYHDVPQPELVKEARRQDIAKPSGNLFRPVPFRAPPKTPTPTKIEEPVEFEPFDLSSEPFSNSPFGVSQPPQFSQHGVPLFPPPSFFNQPSFSQPQFFGHVPTQKPQTAFINGRPVAIQGEVQFPLPPQIRFKERLPQTLPPQPHLNHFVHHHRRQPEQHIASTESRIPPKDSKLTLAQEPVEEINEIIPIDDQPSYSLTPLSTTEIPRTAKPLHSESSSGLSELSLNTFKSEENVVVETSENVLKPTTQQPKASNQFVSPVQEGPIAPLKPTTKANPPLTTVVPFAIPFSQNVPNHNLCSKQGLRSDPFRCPIFHECILENNQWQVYTWRCPRGKYFDESSSTCIKGYC